MWQHIRQQIDSVTVKDQGNENLKQIEAVHMHNTVFIEAFKT